VIVCWSLKGGSGTTVVSAALALTLAQRNNATVRIVDLAGDIPSALGIAEPSGEGVTNWLQQPQRAPIQSLQIPVTARVSLLPRGTGPLMHHGDSYQISKHSTVHVWLVSPRIHPGRRRDYSYSRHVTVSILVTN